MGAPLSVAITPANGEPFRWGPDEGDAGDIPQEITFSTSMPGGFKAATITLPRRIDLEYPDLNLLDNVEILAPGNKIVWEGRIQQLPRSHAESPTITVGAVGHSAHLMDDPTFREIYVDADLSKWGDPSTARRLQLYEAGIRLVANTSVGLSTLDPATVAPAVINDFTAAQAVGGVQEAGEAVYDSGGADIGQVYYDYDQLSNIAPDEAFDSTMALGTTDTFKTSVTGTDHNRTNAVATQQVVTAPGPGYRFARLRDLYTGAFLGQFGDVIAWENIRPVGRHGLTLRGAWPSVGFYASDVVADVVGRAAPLLNCNGSIQPTTFVIPHLVFAEPTTAHDVIMRANGYHLWDWAVWENRLFCFRPPDPTRLTWEVRLSDGAQVDLEGTQVDDVYNGVWVQYADASGRAHSVGPPGSGADATDSSLVDTSPSNPVNAHGIPKKWAVLQISQPTTDVGAIQLGAIYLGEKRLPQRRGALTVTGTATHPTAGERDVCEMRAGDWVLIADHPTDVPRKIIETGHNAGAQATVCTLDNTSQKVDAILERLGVKLVGTI